ncbi:MAG: hypothetical protein WDZ59_08060, partial [Pirellulales bacterium]
VPCGELDLRLCKDQVAPTIFEIEPFGENVEGLFLWGLAAFSEDSLRVKVIHRWFPSSIPASAFASLLSNAGGSANRRSAGEGL